MGLLWHSGVALNTDPLGIDDSVTAEGELAEALGFSALRFLSVGNVRKACWSHMRTFQPFGLDIKCPLCSKRLYYASSRISLSSVGEKGQEHSMTHSFNGLVERQIQKALAEGKLSGLEGEGKPLRDRSGEAYTDMATAVAVRIMAEAGALPEEFKIRKLLDAARQRYREAEGGDAKHVAMALIADLELRYNIAVEARRRFMGS